MSSGLGIRRRRVPSAFAAGEFEVHPLLVVPGLVRGLQADGGRDNVERTMTHDEPLVLRRQRNESATLWPLFAVGVAARAPQRRDARSRPRNGGEVPVSTTAPSLRHKSRTRRSRAMQTVLRLAHSLLIWTITIGQGACGILPVTTIPSRAHEEHLCVQETWIDVHVQSLRKVSLVESAAQ